MPTTKAGQKAVNKYIAKAYDRVNLVLKKIPARQRMKFKPLPIQRV